MNIEDNVVWLNTKNDIFPVKSFYCSLSYGKIEALLFGIVWNSWVPSKISFFAWEAT